MRQPGVRLLEWKQTISQLSKTDEVIRCEHLALNEASRWNLLGADRFRESVEQIGLVAAAMLAGPRLERAIGVIYRPESECLSHYFRARIAEQFDVVLHYDRTRAVEPLERSAAWVTAEVPETFPSAL